MIETHVREPGAKAFAQRVYADALREAGYAAHCSSNNETVTVCGGVPCEIAHRASVIAMKASGGEVVDIETWHERNWAKAAEYGYFFLCTCEDR